MTQVHSMKKRFTFLTVLLIVLILGQISASADIYNEIVYKKDISVNSPAVSRILYLPQLKGYKNLKVSGTNKKMDIVVYETDQGNKTPYLIIRFWRISNNKRVELKSGKATVTVTGKKSGKKKTVKFNLNLVKGTFINPVTSFKVGSMELKNKFNKGRWMLTYSGKLSDDGKYTQSSMLSKFSGKKLNIKLKKNWKILSCTEGLLKAKPTTGETIFDKTYNIKNGGQLKKISISDKYRTAILINLIVVNEKTNVQEEILISVD